MEIVISSATAPSVGKMKGIESSGKNVLIANLNGKYYAIGNTCTHEGCSLSDGRLNGEKVQCPCHESTFDVRTGQVLMGPAQKSEPAYQLKIDGDQIRISV